MPGRREQKLFGGRPEDPARAACGDVRVRAVCVIVPSGERGFADPRHIMPDQVLIEHESETTMSIMTPAA